MHTPSWDLGAVFVVVVSLDGFIECTNGVTHQRFDESGQACFASDSQWQSHGSLSGVVMQFSLLSVPRQPRTACTALPLACTAHPSTAMPPARKSSSSGPKDPGKGPTTPRKEAKGKSTAKASAFPPPTAAAQMEQILPKADAHPALATAGERHRTKSPPKGEAAVVPRVTTTSATSSSVSAKATAAAAPLAAPKTPPKSAPAKRTTAGDVPMGLGTPESIALGIRPDVNFAIEFIRSYFRTSLGLRDDDEEVQETLPRGPDILKLARSDMESAYKPQWVLENFTIELDPFLLGDTETIVPSSVSSWDDLQTWIFTDAKPKLVTRAEDVCPGVWNILYDLRRKLIPRKPTPWEVTGEIVAQVRRSVISTRGTTVNRALADIHATCRWAPFEVINLRSPSRTLLHPQLWAAIHTNIMGHAPLMTKVVTMTESHNGMADTHDMLFTTILNRPVVEEAWRLLSSDPPEVEGAQNLLARLFGYLKIPTTHNAKHLMGWISAVNDAITSASTVVEKRVRAAREFFSSASAAAEVAAAPKGKAKAAAPKSASPTPAAKATVSSSGSGQGKASAPIPPSGDGTWSGGDSGTPGGRPPVPPIPELPAVASMDPHCTERRDWENYTRVAFWKGPQACAMDEKLKSAGYPERSDLFFHEGLLRGGENARTREDGTYPRKGDDALGCFIPVVAWDNPVLAKPLTSLAANKSAYPVPKEIPPVDHAPSTDEARRVKASPALFRRCSARPALILPRAIEIACGGHASLG